MPLIDEPAMRGLFVESGGMSLNGRLTRDSPSRCPLSALTCPSSHGWQFADEQQTSYAGTIEQPCVRVLSFQQSAMGSRGGIKAQSRRMISQATAME
jgi:hypothetical protein